MLDFELKTDQDLREYDFAQVCARKLLDLPDPDQDVRIAKLAHRDLVRATHYKHEWFWDATKICITQIPRDTDNWPFWNYVPCYCGEILWKLPPHWRANDLRYSLDHDEQLFERFVIRALVELRMDRRRAVV